MTDKFKRECEEQAYKNRLAKITFEDETISNSDNLCSIEISDSCISDGAILGNTNSKSIKFNMLNNYNLIDKDINAFIGVKYADSSEEYLNMGKYIISEEINDVVAKNGEYKGFDYSKKLDQVYKCSIEDIENATVEDFYVDICNQLNLIPKSLDFINKDIVIGGNPFTNNETCRTVLQNIAQVACSFLDVDWETNEIDLIWVNDEIIETFEKKDYSELEKGEIVGPINSVVITDDAVEGENIVLQDEESIAINGLKEISISGNYFLFTEDLRRQAIDLIFNRLNGFTYVNYKLTSYTGKPYLKRGNKISIQNTDDVFFDSYVFSHTFTYDGTFKSVLEAPILTQTQTLIKNGKSVSSYFRKVERICNKIDGKLEDTIEQVNEDGEKITNVTQSVSDLTTVVEDNKYYIDENGNKELISSAVYNLKQTTDGAISSISTTSGNNVFRNAIGLFDSEYWEGTCNPFTNTELQKESGQKSCWLLANGNQKQTVELKNGDYTVSFTYKKLVELANVSVKINDISYSLNNLDFTDFCQTVFIKDNRLSIEFISDTDNSCYILNLMGNVGSVVQPFSNNPNETVTDTVMIGKGLEITSNTMNTKLSANADGVRIENASNGESITEFTDKGMISKDLEATGTSKVSGLLMMKVNGHVWLTGLE